VLLSRDASDGVEQCSMRGSLRRQVFQRQLSKEGLQTVVNNSSKPDDGAGGSGGGAADGASIGANLMSAEELRDLFTLRQHTLSDTYDSMCGDDGDGPKGGGGGDGGGRDGGGGGGGGGDVGGSGAGAVCRQQVPRIISTPSLSCVMHWFMQAVCSLAHATLAASPNAIVNFSSNFADMCMPC
jgi:hypothetical protein